MDLHASSPYELAGDRKKTQRKSATAHRSTLAYPHSALAERTGDGNKTTTKHEDLLKNTGYETCTISADLFETQQQGQRQWRKVDKRELAAGIPS
ncbi:hypothetical protein VTN00DRAFT_4256 [Thermoascus crustaceus]|uniref:uncharacterized protein n=1 Tax=Thermoascus crustaceus TaxID=5088 RepID=UPI0037445A52